jgi:hypothetical protein
VICNVIPIFISKTSCKDQQHGQVICKLDQQHGQVICKLDQQQGQVICKLDQQEDNAICVCKLEEQQHNVLLHLQKSTHCKHQQQNNLNYNLKDQQKQQSHFKEKFEGGR